MTPAKPVSKSTAEAKTQGRSRSPVTVSYALPDSLEDARKLYKRYSHADFSAAEVASSLGMTASSSRVGKRIYAMTEYGLIEEAGTGHKVTKRFHVLDSTDRGNSEFKQAAYDAVKSVDLFRELIESFRGKLPDQDVVSERLERQRGFNAERAKEVASIIHRSLTMSGVLDANNNILPIRENGGAAEKPAADESSASSKEEESTAGEHRTTQQVFVGADQSGRGQSSPPAPAQKGLHRSEVPLSDGRMAVVFYPLDLSPKEAEKIGRVLGALVD